jgi:hypothetical protein
MYRQLPCALSVPGSPPWTQGLFAAGTMLCRKDYRYTVSVYITLMPSQIGKDFEEYARCCSELALEALTPENRKRMLKMAREYMRAAKLMRRTSESSSLDERMISI